MFDDAWETTVLPQNCEPTPESRSALRLRLQRSRRKDSYSKVIIEACKDYRPMGKTLITKEPQEPRRARIVA